MPYADPGSVALAWIPSGDEGIYRTVAAMRQLARRAALDPGVRRTAGRLVLGAPPESVVPILVHWISDHTEFLPDPSPAEWLLDPVQSLDLILRDGVAQLDCDDVATLAAAMALSIGLRARFVVAAFHTPKAPYQHVWTEVSPSGGRWTPIDPTRPAQGFRAFPISRLFVEEV